MTKSTFHRLLLDCDDCTNLDEYIAEVGGSLPEEYYSDDGDASRAIELLTIVWELHENFTFSAIRKLSALSQRNFALTYNIPQRTIENWDAGDRVPPEYLLELLAADVITEKFEYQDEA